MGNTQEIGNIGVGLSLDSAGFNTGMANINRQLKVAQAEFQAASSKLGQLGDVTDKMKLQADSLAKQLELQKQKVSALSAAYDKSVQSKGADAKASQDLQIKLLKAQKQEYDLAGQLDRTNKELGQQKKGWESIAPALTKVTQLAVAAGAALAAAIGGVVAFGVKGNASMEQYQSTLATVLKSEQAAVEVLQWATNFAASTPFEIPGIVEATTRLESYGLKATQVLPMVGDMASVMGKDLMMAVEAVADAQTGELERLKEFGITKNMILEEGAKKGLGTLIDAKGQITDMAKFNEALMALMDEKFKGGMERQSKTAIGAWSNVVDFFGTMAREISKPIFDKIKNGLNDFLKLVDKWKKDGTLAEWKAKATKALQDVGAAVQKVGGYFINTAKWIYDNWNIILPILLTVLSAITSYMIVDKVTKLFQVWAGVTKIVAAAQQLLNLVMSANPIGIVIAAIAALVVGLTYLYKTNETARYYILKAWYGIVSGVLAYGNFMLSAMEKIWGWIPGLGEKLAAAKEKVGGMLAEYVAKYAATTKEGVANEMKMQKAQEESQKAFKETGEAGMSAYDNVKRGATGAGDAQKKAAEEAKKAAKNQKEAAKTTSDAWDRAGDRIKLQFSKMQDKAQEAFKAMQKAQRDSTEGTYDTYIKELEDEIKGIDDQGRAEDEAKKIADRQQRINETKDKIAQAQREGDLQAVKDYEQDLKGIYEDAERERREKERDNQKQELETRIKKLEEIKTLELKNLQSRHEQEEKAFKDKQENQKLQFEQELKIILEQNTKRHLSYDQGLKQINGLMAKWGGEMYTSGATAGQSFADGISSKADAVRAAAIKLAEAASKPLKLHSPADEGPLSSLDSWWTPFSDTLLKGFKFDSIKAALNDVAAL
ncbi:MAG: hypothetical protein ACYC4E_01710, partial [Carboxydocellales bacterium]